jgi:cobaltochelatase CobS
MMSQTATAQRRRPARKPAQADVPEVQTIPENDLAERNKQQFGIREVFGIDLGYEEDASGKPIKDNNGKKVPKERHVWGFDAPTQWTPKIDPAHVFPPEETKALLLGLELRDRILIVGETGTGKTTLLEQVAARLNYNVVKINFDGGITRADLIGEHLIKGQEMYFQYGILVHAFKMPGTIIILDEWDTISGECAFVLQRPLDKNDGKILIMETGGELIPIHEDNIIAATANTTGQGDETGLYAHGTKVQNYSQLNRFNMTIRMEYLKPEREMEMLMKHHPTLKKEEAQALVKAITQVREGYIRGELSVPLSPRDLINWAGKYLHMGDPIRAGRYCFLNRMPREDAQVTEQLIQRSFEGG